MSEQSTCHNPQNPYKSWLVAASAGSGKTYQLSRRFLHLVAAGAEPGSILTVTFTIKAAAEMRLRILEDAGRLTQDQDFAREFAADCAHFHKPHVGRRPPPLAPPETGDRILQASQVLKITTIDAIFLEWVARFPYEAGADPTGNQTIPAPFDLVNRLDEEMFRNLAWKALCRHISGKLSASDSDEEAAGDQDPDDSYLQEALASERISGLRRLIQELRGMDTYLWHEEMISGSALLLTDCVSDDEDEDEDEDPLCEKTLVAAMDHAIRAVASSLANKAKADGILLALGERSLLALQQAGLLTKQFLLNGQTVSKKVKESLPDAVALIEGELARFNDLKKIRALNKKGVLSYHLYQLYRFFYNQLRFARNAAEFSDLVKGSFALFNSAGSLGVKYLLTRTIHHLMLDEFQDTSVLQWSVFKEIADHLLAGESLEIPPGPAPSLFVVGDEKQSIYGFREADPEVMRFIRETYKESMGVAPLNESYRTANVILDFVNRVFTPLIKDFPKHETAVVNDEPFIPNLGRVGILKELPTKKVAERTGADDVSKNGESSESSEAEPLENTAEQEAEAIAALLKHALTNAKDFPVFDKKKKTWRPLCPEDCAVLYRSGTHAGRYESAIRGLDIPCQREEEKGYFERPEITDMLALMNYLASPADLVALLSVAKSRLGAVPDQVSFAALEACRSFPARSSEYLKILQAERPAFVAALADLTAAAGKLPPHELIVEAYKCLNVLSAYEKSALQTANEARLAEMNLIALVSRTLQAESAGMTSLFDVCRCFASLRKLDEIGNAATAGNAVRLMTIHKSKGLEYPFVILADSGRAFAKEDAYWTQVRQWQDGRREDRVIFSGSKGERPSDPDWDVNRHVNMANQRTIDEAHRLLYVAITRAQHYLYVTGHVPNKTSGLAATVFHPHLLAALSEAPAGKNYDAGQEQTIGGLVYREWRADAAHVIVTSPSGTDEAGQQHETLDLRPTAPDALALQQELVITSPSKAARTEHEGPSAGDWHHLLHPEPLPETDAALVGTLIHKAIENHLNQQSFDLASELATAGIVDGASIKVTQDLLKKACNSKKLARLVEGHTFATEVPLAAIRNDELVRGSVDLIIEQGDRLVVVDYKTTRFAPSLASANPLELLLLREFAKDRGYVQQLELYRATLKQIHPDKRVDAVIWFVDIDYLLEV